jgi:uncharacterized protein (DUF427 family)
MTTIKDRAIKQPGPDHPIAIEANPARLVVSVAGRVVADTQDALTLREAGHPPVQYVGDHPQRAGQAGARLAHTPS